MISAFVFATRIVQFLFNFKLLACFCDCTARFVLHLVGNPEDRFSRVAARYIFDLVAVLSKQIVSRSSKRDL